jgi:hypothetical protein
MTEKKKEPWEKLEDSKARGDVLRRKLDETGSIRQERLDDMDRDADTSRERFLKKDIEEDHEAYDS